MPIFTAAEMPRLNLHLPDTARQQLRRGDKDRYQNDSTRRGLFVPLAQTLAFSARIGLPESGIRVQAGLQVRCRTAGTNSNTESGSSDSDPLHVEDHRLGG